jgi:hypothetical protein
MTGLSHAGRSTGREQRIYTARDDGHPEAGCDAPHLGELLFRCGRASPQAVDFAEPTVFAGLGDPLFEAIDERRNDWMSVPDGRLPLAHVGDAHPGGKDA